MLKFIGTDFVKYCGHILKVERDLDVPSSSVPKKYDGTSNMAEFRSSRPTPLQAMLETRIPYISNSHCHIVILVGLHVLVVRTKYK